MALGYTMALPTEDRYLQSKTEFEDKIAGLLGGNVAERLVFGDTTTGASNDIEKATDLARRMVTEFGMSDKLGPLSFGKRDELVFLGREIGEQRNYSDEVAKQIDEEVRAIIDRAYERATEVLDDPPRQARRPGREARRRGDRRHATASRRSSPTCRRRRTSTAPPPIVAGAEPADARRPSPRRTRSRPDRRADASRPSRTAPAEPTARRRSWPRPTRPSRAGTIARMTTTTAPTPRSRPTSTRTPTSALESYLEFLRIPSISALPEHAAGLPPGGASGSPPSSTRIGIEHVEVVETGGHPVVYARLAPRAGRADGHRLLPLRRPAGRPARPVGDRRRSSRSSRTAGCSAAARPTTRASSTCTCGRPRRSWRRAARCRSTCKFVFEGEEESSSVHLDAVARGQPRPARAPTSRVISDTGFFEGNLPAITRRPARDACTPRST